MPGMLLMENAGRNAAHILRSLGTQGPVAICCGKGNNGGDGFVIARHLDLQLVPVRILLLANPEELQGDALINFRIADRARLHTLPMHGPHWNDQRFASSIADCEWIVDALFGTGLEGPLRPPFDRAVQLINQSGKRILAVDIPSGLDCDTGQPLGPTIQAQHTVTFVAQKIGFQNPAARQWTGEIHVADIGAPRAALPTDHP